MTLPDCTLAALRRSRALPDARRTAALDALVVLTAPDDAALLRAAARSAALAGLHARAQSRRHSNGAAPRSANARQTMRATGLCQARRQHLRAPEPGRQAACASWRRASRGGSDSWSTAPRRCGAVVRSTADARPGPQSFALPDFRSRRRQPWQLQTHRAVRGTGAAISTASPPARAPATWCAP